MKDILLIVGSVTVFVAMIEILPLIAVSGMIMAAMVIDKFRNGKG